MEYELMGDYREGINVLERYLSQPNLPQQQNYPEHARQRIAMLKGKLEAQKK